MAWFTIARRGFMWINTVYIDTCPEVNIWVTSFTTYNFVTIVANDANWHNYIISRNVWVDLWPVYHLLNRFENVMAIFVHQSMARLQAVSFNVRRSVNKMYSVSKCISIRRPLSVSTSLSPSFSLLLLSDIGRGPPYLLLFFSFFFSSSSIRYWTGPFVSTSLHLLLFLFFFYQILDGALLQGVYIPTRICESTTGYTFTPSVGSFTSPGIDTR